MKFPFFCFHVDPIWVTLKLQWFDAYLHQQASWGHLFVFVANNLGCWLEFSRFSRFTAMLSMLLRVFYFAKY